MASVQKLSYLNAVIEESLRIYPPAALSLSRVVPRGGAMICNKHVPAGTGVGVTSWAATHSPQNFMAPEEFAPERWLDDPGFAKDDRQASQPFSMGARNCVGKKYGPSVPPRHSTMLMIDSLAYAEMRLLLARLAMDFDFQLLPESERWIVQKLFTFWEKPPLMVKLTRATQAKI